MESLLPLELEDLGIELGTGEKRQEDGEPMPARTLTQGSLVPRRPAIVRPKIKDAVMPTVIGQGGRDAETTSRRGSAINARPKPQGGAALW